MRSTMARAIFAIMKWFWVGVLATFLVAYAANIGLLPFKQVANQFYDSTFGMLLLPGPHLILTLSVLGLLLLLTFGAWLVARRAPEEVSKLPAAGGQQSQHNVGDTTQAQDNGQAYLIKQNPGSTFIFPGTPATTASSTPSRGQREELLNKYLDVVINHNRSINLMGIEAPSSLPLFSVNVPLDQIFIHLRAVSDRPRFGMALEREQLKQEILRIYERSDLIAEEREEHIQQLRAAVWRSEMVETMVRSLTEMGKELEIEDVFKDLTVGNPVAILLGRPGAGKSTTMRWLALRMARALRSNGPSEPIYTPAQFPLLLRIGEYAAYLVEHNILRQIGSDGRAHLFMAFMKQNLAEINPALPDMICAALAEGRCLLLLDGLDEVASDDLRRQVAMDIYAFLNQYCLNQETREQFNRVIITSRIIGYEPGPLSQYHEYTLLDLSEPQINAFLSAWCPAVELWLMGKETRSQEKSDLTDQSRRAAREAGERQRDDLLRSFHDNPGIRRLAANPLMLTILALIQRSGGRLPHRRIDLYKSVTRTLLDNWNRMRGGKRFSDDEIGIAEDVLSAIAFEMHHRDLPLTRQRVLKVARASLAYPQTAETILLKNVEQFLETLSKSSGLFVERGQGLYGFMHRTFQEYYAARYLLDGKSYAPGAPIMAGSADLITFAAAHYQLPLWREPLLLAVSYISEQEKRGTQANTLIRAVLNAPAPCDAILQRHLLFAAACVVDCNVLYIDQTLQGEIATRLLDLYGDSLGAGRYTTLQQEIEAVVLLWLRGQPKESSIKTPPLLETWRAGLCDENYPQRQEGAVHLLASLAPDLSTCPQAVLLELIPPLLQLADVLDISGIPFEMHSHLPNPPARPACFLIEDYAVVALRMLDKAGPAGWLHTQWKAWVDEQPNLLIRLMQHSLELDYLLTPAAYVTASDTSSWKRQHEFLSSWREEAQLDPINLQARLLQDRNTSHYPYSWLYWHFLSVEIESPRGENWQVVWDHLLSEEMTRGRSATYQTCLALRLLLAGIDEDRRKVILATLLQHLSSRDSRLQSQSANIIANIYANINPNDMKGLGDLRNLIRPRDMIGLAGWNDLRELRDKRELGGMLLNRQIDHKRLTDRHNIVLFSMGYEDLIDILSMKDWVDLDTLLHSLCDTLEQDAESFPVLFALYSVISNVNVMSEPLRQRTDQSLERMNGQKLLPTEQRLLVNVLRQHIRLAAFPLPLQASTQLEGSADERASLLARLKEYKQLGKTELETLFSALHDKRELSGIVSEKIRGELFAGFKRSVAWQAWRLAEEQWSMQQEAWQAVVTHLDDEDALICGAAALLLRKGRDIPSEERERAIKCIQAILNDELRSRRPLDIPDETWIRLDDVLFDTLLALVEREWKPGQDSFYFYHNAWPNTN